MGCAFLRTRACNPFQDQLARDNVTTRPFSPRFQFQVASFLSFVEETEPLPLSARCQQQTDHPLRWKAGTRWGRGWRSDEKKERMGGNDKKSRKIARKIFQARYGGFLIRAMRKKSLNAALWFIGGRRLATEGQGRTWPGIKCPIKYCGHVNILVKFSSAGLASRIDHVFSSRRWYDRRYSFVWQCCSDVYLGIV